MDTNLILSLLNKSGNTEISSLLSLLKNDGSGKNNDKLFSLLAEKMMRKGGDKPCKSVSILGFVNDDILGKITRYMARYNAKTKNK